MHRLASSLFLAGVVFILSACGIPPYDQQEMKSFLQQDMNSSMHTVKTDGRELHYVSVKSNDNKKRPLVIFVHGSPGDWSAFGRYLGDHDLQDNANMISIDRLGFGKSQPGQTEPSLEKQALLLHEVIQENKKKAKRIVLVGHSYGGPLLARYAMDYPKSAHTLLMLAPAVDPDIQEKKWYQKAANWSPIKAILPEPLTVSTEEMLPLKEELQNMEERWDQIKDKVIVIQGRKGWLVPPGHAAFIKKKLPKAEVTYLEKQGHFLPWEEYELVKKTILGTLKK